MRIQIASDLHLEFLSHRLPQCRLVEPDPAAEVLVLAGDIHNGTRGLAAFADWPVPVIYVAGNHEYYGHVLPKLQTELRAAAQQHGVHYLDQDVLTLAGVRFLGATLWTDFALAAPRTLTNKMAAGAQSKRMIAMAMAQAHRSMNDYWRIEAKPGTPLYPQDTLRLHRTARAWLQQQLRTPFSGPTVVVTHHAPHARSVHSRHAGSPLNPAFASNLDELLPAATLWVHGHTHDSFDYVASGCRIVANPCGYLYNHATLTEARQARYENPCFAPQLTVSCDPTHSDVGVPT